MKVIVADLNDVTAFTRKMNWFIYMRTMEALAAAPITAIATALQIDLLDRTMFVPCNWTKCRTYSPLVHYFFDACFVCSLLTFCNVVENRKLFTNTLFGKFSSIFLHHVQRKTPLHYLTFRSQVSANLY